MGRDKYSGNNLLALLTIMFIVFSIWSTWVTTHGIGTTGRASQDAGQVSLCVQRYQPDFIIEYPKEGNIISGYYTIRGKEQSDPESLSSVDYLLYSAGHAYPLGRVLDGVDGYFNLIFNSSKFEDKNCAYQIFSRGNYSSCFKSADRTSGYFTINNYEQRPIWTNFHNNLTTNFSNYTSWVRLQNVTIGIPHKGMIEFGNASINLDNANLNSYFLFDQYSFEIGTVPCVANQLFQIQPNVTFFNVSYYNPRVYRGGAPCSLAQCEPLPSINGTYKFRLKISGAGKYTLHENAWVELSIYDDTGGAVKYYTNQPVHFYANLTNSETNESVYDPNVYCLIRFRLDYENEQYYRMSYNSSSNLFTYKRSFPHPNTPNRNHEWGVWCNASVMSMGTVGWIFDNFEIMNQPPVLTTELPNETWPANTPIVYVDLDDYFTDYDLDPMNYSATPVSNILVEINKTTHQVTFTPDTDWWGNRTVTFKAQDVWNATAQSNLVYLRVVQIPEPKETKQEPSPSPNLNMCVPDWVCGNWTECKPTGIKTRDCDDLNLCNVSMWAPDMVMNCTYIPTCFDHFKNGNETGVDCGGNCLPCPTCSDGIKNQAEKGVDCGGPCLPCPSCFDGILNQGETQIDCGGPCSACPTCSDMIKNGYEEGVDCGGSQCKPCEKNLSLEKPTISRALWSIFLISLALAIAFAILLRSKIISLFGYILKAMARVHRPRAKTSLFDAEIGPYTEIQASFGEISSMADLKDIMENFFMFLFGDYPDERLPLIISYNEFLSSETNASLIKLHNDIVVKGSGSTFKGLATSSKEAVRETFIEMFLASGMGLMGLFEVMLGAYSELKKAGSKSAMILREELYQVYLRLSLEDKGKVYKKLREIDSQSEGQNAAKQ